MKTKKELLEFLHELRNYYDLTRQIGHTTAMIKGMNDKKVDAIVLTHSQDMGKRIQEMSTKKKNLRFVTHPYNLRGCRKPLLIDNAAMWVILNDTIEHLEKSVDTMADDATEQTINEIKTQLQNCSQKLIFEPMTNKTLMNAKSSFDTILQPYKNNNQIKNYNIDVDYDLENNMLCGRFAIQPTKLAESIALDFTISPTEKTKKSKRIQK